ncbi:MAG: hypothetical protein COA49_09580 [Bacteroidetes bacterium]|nr:MAG: hypothetical protein COA49_09580 [Bacteroidota bacterium]
MNLICWRLISLVNKLLLPKIYTKADLTRLSSIEKGIVWWKMFTTYRYLDAVKQNGHKIV